MKALRVNYSLPRGLGALSCSARLLAPLLGVVLLAAGVSRSASPESGVRASAAPGVASALQVGDLDAAIRGYRDTALRHREASDTIPEFRALLGLADTLVSAGAPLEARRPLARAEELAEQLKSSHPPGSLPAADAAAYLATYGRLHLSLGELERAEQTLAAASEAAAELNAWALLARIEGDRAALHAARSQPALALARYQQSAVYAHRAQASIPRDKSTAAGESEQKELHLLEARALANAARAALHAGQHPLAQELADRGLEATHEVPPGRPRVFLSLNLALSYRALAAAEPPVPSSTVPPAGNAEETTGRAALHSRAHALLRESLASAQALNDRLASSFALGYLAQLRADAGQSREALQLTRRALAELQNLQAPEQSARLYWQQARYQEALGQRADALASYRRTVELFQPLRPRTGLGYQRSAFSFEADFAPAYLELVALLIDESKRAPRPNLRTALLREARSVVELRKAAELQDYFKDECVEDARRARRDIDTVAGQALVVYPILFADRIELLVTLPGGRIEHIRAGLDAARLRHQVEQLRSLLENRTTRQYLRPARTLYDALIAPLEPILKEHPTSTLVFVPDGPLRRIPMAALHNGEHFLIERHAIAITPGIELTDPRPLDVADLHSLFAGVSEAVGGFAALPGVPVELRASREILGGELLLDQGFQTESLDAALDRHPFRLIHIATHGEFKEDARESFLLTHDGRLKLDELGEQVSRFRFREAPLELLTLSACETATGSERAALGLSGMAVRAGARSVLGTLWLVNDLATSELLSAFYRALYNEKLSRAAALRQAQRGLIDSSGHHHPGYWSAFVLIGSWL